MNECPQCGQIPGPDDEQCPHCGFPFDEEAQATYRPPHLKKIEEEILSQVIARVEAHWARQREEAGARRSQASADEPVPATSAAPQTETDRAPKRPGTANWLRRLSWIQLALGLVGAGVFWSAAGGGIMSGGYIRPFLVVASVFAGVAGWMALRALAAILEAVSGGK